MQYLILFCMFLVPDGLSICEEELLVLFLSIKIKHAYFQKCKPCRNGKSKHRKAPCPPLPRAGSLTSLCIYHKGGAQSSENERPEEKVPASCSPLLEGLHPAFSGAIQGWTPRAEVGSQQTLRPASGLTVFMKHIGTFTLTTTHNLA